MNTAYLYIHLYTISLGNSQNRLIHIRGNWRFLWKRHLRPEKSKAGQEAFLPLTLQWYHIFPLLSILKHIHNQAFRNIWGLHAWNQAFPTRTVRTPAYALVNDCPAVKLIGFLDFVLLLHMFTSFLFGMVLLYIRLDLLSSRFFTFLKFLFRRLPLLFCCYLLC